MGLLVVLSWHSPIPYTVVIYTYVRVSKNYPLLNLLCIEETSTNIRNLTAFSSWLLKLKSYKFISNLIPTYFTLQFVREAQKLLRVTATYVNMPSNKGYHTLIKICVSIKDAQHKSCLGISSKSWNERSRRRLLKILKTP